jgi:hypothetical protein
MEYNKDINNHTGICVLRMRSLPIHYSDAERHEMHSQRRRWER